MGEGKISITLRPENDGFVAFMPLGEFISSSQDTESLLKSAAEAYRKSVVNMRTITNEIKSLRANHKITPARTVWLLGNMIFNLVNQMQKMSLEIDGLYNHLERDLCVKRKWLEKVIILRRYIPEQSIIPESLNWGLFEKGTRHVAENLIKGVLPTKK